MIDPDPDEIYTKRKARVSNISKDTVPSSSVKYPSDGWGKSLERMPSFTRAEMNQHVANSGKRVANAEHHSIPTNLRKAKTFLEDEYLKEIVFFVLLCVLCQAKSFKPPVHVKLAKLVTVTMFWH